MKYRKMLVAIDMTSKSSVVFERALDLARQLDAELSIFYCVQQETVAEAEHRIGTVAELELADAQRTHDQQRSVALDHARAWVESLAKLAAEQGITAHSSAEEGNPGQRICALAAHWGAELIVLGKTSRSAIAGILLGSVSGHVAHHAPCSVFLVRQ